MSWKYSTLIIAPALASLSVSAALPAFDARDGVNNDVIRFMKCGNLFYINPEVGGFEQGMAGYWSDVNNLNPPDEHAIFNMSIRVDDYFYNGKGRDYGAETGGGGRIDGTFTDPTSDPAPMFALSIGYAKRKAGNTITSYNCFTDSLQNGFEYEDPQYGTCKSWVWCVQKDALKLYAKATEDVITARDLSLPKPEDIYSLFHERYDSATGICDETTIGLKNSGIGDSCSVKFECKNNDMQSSSTVMNTLIDNLKQFTKPEVYREERRKGPCVAVPNGPCVQNPDSYLYRTMPKVTQLVARGQPPQDSGRFGYEISFIKTTIECKTGGLDKTLCSALGGLFSIGTLAPPTAVPGAFAGAALAVGCGLGGD